MLKYTMCVMHAFLTYNCVKNFIWKKKLWLETIPLPTPQKTCFSLVSDLCIFKLLYKVGRGL